MITTSQLHHTIGKKKKTLVWVHQKIKYIIWKKNKLLKNYLKKKHPSNQHPQKTQ
jgi:hypothetical protein